MAASGREFEAATFAEPTGSGQRDQPCPGKKRKKKDKRSRRRDKKKKNEKRKHGKHTESTDGSSSSEEWVEADPVQTRVMETTRNVEDTRPGEDMDSHTAQRDAWMSMDFTPVETVSSASLRAEKDTLRKAKREESEGQSWLLERELNPYWKDGGSGLPSENHALAVAKAPGVADGGLSWLRRSLLRMKEQAQREHRGLDDVVAEKYGSMDAFQAKLRDAEEFAWKSEDRGREPWTRPAHARGPRGRPTSHVSDSGTRKTGSHGTRSAAEGASSGHGHDEDTCVRPDTGSLETSRDPAPRQTRDSRGRPRPTFLRPCEDDERPFRATRTRVEASSSTCVARGMSSTEEHGRATEDHGRDTEERGRATEDHGRATEEHGRATEERGRATEEHGRATEERGRVTEEHGRVTEERGRATERPLENWSCSTRGDGGGLATGESVRRDTEPQGRQGTESTFAGPQPPSTRVMNTDEKNKLGAKILKAEMAGNTELAEKLKAQLKAANESTETVTWTPGHGSRGDPEEEDVVVLTRTDGSGQTWPVNSPGETSHVKAKGRKRQRVPTHEGHERLRYFADDDHLSLRDLVTRERTGTDTDPNRLFMRTASKFTGKPYGDHDTLDDMFVSTAAQHACPEATDDMQRRQAIAEHRTLVAQMSTCVHCVDSSQFPKHLTVAVGAKVYLCLPASRSLTDGHCLVVPLQHLRAATMLDEDVWEEIQTFRKALVKMFEDRGLVCVFLEMFTGGKKPCHMVYECIPLPRDVGDVAPMYFKKAIMEADEEWALNRKLIDLSAKDVRKSVPRGLPYFAVNFGLQGGFAHVIENRDKFPRYFGKEVIGGLLDLEPRLWRSGVRESFEDQTRKTLMFAQWWKPFDVTKGHRGDVDDGVP